MGLPGNKPLAGGKGWSFIFGSNFPPNYTTNTIENTPAIQNLVKQAGITLLRVAIADGAADSEINARANACAACGCAMLVILPHNDLTFNEHLVTLLGSKCNLYELSNEPDLNSITWQQYLSYWNNQIPALRKINPNAAFGGPALGAFSNVSSYLVPWLNGCKSSGVIPDFVSYHDYPCYQISQTACQPKAPNIGNDGASLRQTVINTLGYSLPIACTEWNIDPTSSPPSYTTQSSFVTPWFHTALDSMVSNNLDMACQFDAGSGDSYRDMISTSSYQPQADYQPMVDKIKQYLGTNSILTGPDTPIGLTQGTKNNAAIPSQMISDLKTMGIRWLRWQPYANAIELSQGQYTWGNLDANVKACNQAGINLMLTVLFPPSWGQSGGFPTPQWTLQFAQAMASRYDGTHGFGQIQGIELGNEDYSINGDNPTALAATMNYCYDKLKQQYPNLIVGPGCCLHRNTSTITSFFQTLWKNAPAKYDYINFHFYCQNNNSSDPSVGGSSFSSFPQLLQQLQTAAQNAGHPNFPIWITESGWPVNSNGGFASNYVVSPQNQANYIKYCLDTLKGLNQPAKYFIYTLGYADQGAPAVGIGHSLGMSLYQVSYSGNPLPAYTMVQNYPKNWGGGSSTGTGIRDYACRAGVRVGSGTSLHDYALRAGIKLPGNEILRDWTMRASVSGGASIFDSFLRAEAPSWGNASDGENWVQAGGSATPSIVSVAPATALASDTFARANQSGWGTASDSETWSIKVGPGTLSIANNEGVCISTGTDTDVQLGTHTTSDFDILCRMAINNYNDICGVQARFTVSGGQPTCYKLLWYTTGLHINKAVAGVNTQLATATFGMNPGQFAWMRLPGVGSTLYGRAWQDGTTEPTTWQVTVQDTSVTGPGGFALLANTASGSSGVEFDHFQASAYASVGQITGATGTNTLRLGTQTPTDAEALVRVSFTQPGDIVGLTLRDQGLSQFVRLRLTASQLQICQQTPSGGFVILSNYAFTPASATPYWLKFRVQGTNVYGKIWQDGTPEPAAWLVTATSSAVSGGGQVGLSVALSQPSDIAQFDHYSVTTASQNAPPPQTRNLDFACRANVQAKSTTPQLDFTCRANVADLISDTEVLVYAARQGPIIRVFPKS